MKHAFEVNCAITAAVCLMSVRAVTLSQDEFSCVVLAITIGLLVFFTLMTKRDE